MDEEKYPECAKVAAVRKESQAIGEFLDWVAAEKGLYLCETGGEESSRFYPASYTIENLLADFFEVDLKAFDAEKAAMLAEIRGEA